MIPLIFSPAAGKSYFLVPLNLGITVIPRGMETHSHIHPVFHLFAVDFGLGRLVCDKEHVPLKQGDLVLINPNEKHIYTTPLSELGYYTFNFYLVEMGKMQRKKEDIRKVFMEPKSFFHLAETDELATYFPVFSGARFIRYHEKVWQEIISLWRSREQSIDAGARQASIYNRHQDPFAIMAQAHTFMLQLNRLLGRTAAPEADADPLLASIYRQIGNLVESDYSLTKLAGALGYHRDYVRKYFRDKAGISITEYVNRARIDRACEYLRTTTRSITEISYMLNFSSSQHFSQVFKKERGLTPREFRRSVE